MTSREKQKQQRKQQQTVAPKHSPIGHGSTFDNQKAQTIISCVSAGTPVTHACKAAGVPYRTYRDWYTKGEKGDQTYRTFYFKMLEAEGQFVTANLVTIQKAAGKTWQAAAWLLERRYPKEFGRRQEITGPDGGPLKVEDTGRERLMAIMQRMADTQTKQVEGPKPNGHGANGHDQSTRPN